MSKANGLFGGFGTYFMAASYMLLGAGMPIADWYLFQMRTSAEVVGVLLGCATFATLWMPGASFPKRERIQSWFLSNGTIGIFGNLAGGLVIDLILRKESEIPASPFAVIHAFSSCFIVYFSYWSSGHQSREYIDGRYEKGRWPEKLPELQEILTLLCGRPKQHDLVRTMQEKVIDLNFEAVLNDDFWRQIEVEVLLGTEEEHRERLTLQLSESRSELMTHIKKPRKKLLMVKND